MEIQEFSLLFLVVIFACIARGEAGCRHLQYLDCRKDHILIMHTFHTFRMLAPGLETCQHACFLDDRCVSYNLGPVFGIIRDCDLNSADHLEFPTHLETFFPGAEYCPIKNPCAKVCCPKHQSCKPNPDFSTYRCEDIKQCSKYRQSGKTVSGVYNITIVPNNTIPASCDLETDYGGWTVIQKRFDESVDFYRGWDDYKRGFGDLNGQFWLGLDAIHNLTNLEHNELRIDLEDFDGKKFVAIYDSFRVGPESENYKLYIGSFEKGNASDSLSYHNMSDFTTKDRDNDKHIRNCANDYLGAWWFVNCNFKSHLNSLYLKTPFEPSLGIHWTTVTGEHKGLKKSEMKIRPISMKF